MDTSKKIIFLTGAGGSGKSYLTSKINDSEILKIDFDYEAEADENMETLTKFLLPILAEKIKRPYLMQNEKGEFAKILMASEKKADKAVKKFLESKGVNVNEKTFYDEIMVPAYIKFFTQIIVNKLAQLPEAKTVLADVGGRKLSCLQDEFIKTLTEEGIAEHHFITLDPGEEIIVENLCSFKLQLDDRNKEVAVFAKRRAFATQILEKLKANMLKFGLEESDFQSKNSDDISCDILTNISNKLSANEEIFPIFKDFIKQELSIDTQKSHSDFCERHNKLKDLIERLDGCGFKILKSSNREKNAEEFIEAVNKINTHKTSVLTNFCLKNRLSCGNAQHEVSTPTVTNSQSFTRNLLESRSKIATPDIKANSNFDPLTF